MMRIYSVPLLLLSFLGLTPLHIASAQDIYGCAADNWEPDDYAKFLGSDSVEDVTPDFLDAVVQEGIIEFYGLRAACKTLIDSERRKNTQASNDVRARQLVRF